MSVEDNASLTYFRLFLAEIQTLRKHGYCNQELTYILTSLKELLTNFSTLKEIARPSQEQPYSIKYILQRVGQACDEFSTFHDECKSTSAGAAFLKAPRWTTELRKLLGKIEVYDFMLKNLGSPSMDVSKKHAQVSALAFLDMLMSQFTDNTVIKWVQLEMKAHENKVAHGVMEQSNIDLTEMEMEIGRRDPMRQLLSCESRSTYYFSLGKFFYEGMELKGEYLHDFSLSARYFSAALGQGVLEAAFYLGELNYNGQGVKKNYKEAFKYYEQGTRIEHGESLHRLGHCLSCGHGTERNKTEARRYYKRSYEAGSAKGADSYGWALFYGSYIPINTKKGFQIMMEAKEKGIKDVNLDLAYCYELGIEVDKRSPSKAYELLLEAYDDGVEWTHLELGKYYERGIGVEKNLVEATRIYREAWKSGTAEALGAKAHYGMSLVRGRGVEEDVKRGLKLLKQTCDKGEPRGLTNMGDCYRYGYGVGKSNDMAAKYYDRAAQIGSALAHFYLGEMSEEGVGLSHMRHKEYYYYHYAAERYNVAAQWKVGLMYEQGRGVERHAKRAFYYFKLSARGGHGKAQDKAGEYIVRGQGIQRSRISDIDSIEEAAEQGDDRARRILRKLALSRLLTRIRRNSSY